MGASPSVKAPKVFGPPLLEKLRRSVWTRRPVGLLTVTLTPESMVTVLAAMVALGPLMLEFPVKRTRPLLPSA